MLPSRRARLAGGLWGLLVGDALGVPYEFHPRAEIPPIEQIEFAPPPGFDRAHKRVQLGTYSDDGAQALCLLDSLLACGTFDPEDFGRRLLSWYQAGYLAVDGDVFDCGVQTGAALRALLGGTGAVKAGPSLESANGNGSLMRVLPLALWHRGPDAELVAFAHAQSCITHGHVRSQACCALYCLWARRILDGHDQPWPDAVATLRRLYADEQDRLSDLEFHIRPDEPLEGQGSGYVVDCLRSARWAVDRGPYEVAVKAAISLGRDTDTTACVTGGIAGLRDGVDAIPARWRDALRGQELFLPLVDQLLARAG
jgi:ADP-ribosyl-[dinitrogen reductase] hydrolase